LRSSAGITVKSFIAVMQMRWADLYAPVHPYCHCPA
jgi:hypothetical protein